MKGKETATAQRPPSNLVFLVDVSGSMNSPDRLPLVQQSLRMLTERLTENDRVSLVTYAGSTAVVLPSTNGQDKPRILADFIQYARQMSFAAHHWPKMLHRFDPIELRECGFCHHVERFTRRVGQQMKMQFRHRCPVHNQGEFY